MLPFAAYSQKPTITYRNSTDSSVNCYLIIKPTGLVKGVLVLSPGFEELPECVYTETDLARVAAQPGLLAIIVTLQQGFNRFT